MKLMRRLIMSNNEKTQGELLQERLSYKPESAWLRISQNEKDEIFSFNKSYIDFLNCAKTERESIEWAEAEARKNGFAPLNEAVKSGRKLKPGDKVYAVNKNKNIILAVIGKSPIEAGLNMVGSHVDAPRIDLKPNPLYEDGELALLKTHYYGGIKKYQWAAMPLAIHGVIFKSNGEKVTIKIGENEDDPKFCITDLLPHLAQEQMQKKMSEGITGEGLNIILGSIPYNDEKVKNKVKLNILDMLQSMYGIKEEDFLRAEIEVVPAFKACDAGLDRSMVGAYGQDDRICAYTSFRAVLEAKDPVRTALCILVDKEEIGSAGNTGMQSQFLENTIAKLCKLTSDNYSDLILRDAMSNSKFLSADVTAAVDPTYEEVNDKRNATYLGKGVALMKYTGSRGKSGASDANAEYVAEITNLLNNNNVIWQSGELGKVDAGGGGTIALFLAKYGMDVIDIGPGLLSMHAPYEISSKIDVFMAYKAFNVFYNESAL
jgi:aspartyl aminopeptidase